MSNNKVLWYSSIYNVVLSNVALDLGLTTSIIKRPQNVEVVEDIGALEAIWGIITIVLNNLGSFTQLLTFQVDVPYIYKVLLFTPIGILLVAVIISIIRKG